MTSGLGLGAILCRAVSVTDRMVEASSIGLANSLIPEERSRDLLYPGITRIREISGAVALAVIRAAQAAVNVHFLLVTILSDFYLLQLVDRAPQLRELSDVKLLAFIESKMWNA